MNRTNQSIHLGYFKQKKPVRYEKSVIGLLKRKKTCVLCKQEFPYGSYNRHFAQCSLADDDSEVEVLDQFDAEEKSRRAAAAAVVLDESIDENMVPTLIFVNKDDLSINQQPSQNAESATKSPEQPLRRSTRLSLQNQNKTICSQVPAESPDDEVTEIIQQEVLTNASQENVEPQNESTSDFVATDLITDDIIWATTTTPRRSTRLLNSQKNEPNQLTPTRNINESTNGKAIERLEETMERLEETMPKVTDLLREGGNVALIFLEEMPKVTDLLGEGGNMALSFLEEMTKVDKLPTKRTRASALQVNEDQPSTSRALNTLIQSENASQTRVIEYRETLFGSQAIEFTHEDEGSPPKRQKLEKIAEQIVAQIDANFASQLSEPTDMNVTDDMANEDESNQSAPAINLHYTISFTLRIIRRVLSTPTLHGWRYDETFWGRDIELIKNFVFMGNGARRLLMRLFLRKRKWFTVEDINQKNNARTQITLLAEQATFLADLKELIENRFVDTEERITSLDTALNLCSLEKVRMVAKQFKIDHTKTKAETIVMLLKHSTSQRTIFGTGKIASQMLTVTKKTIGQAFRINESFDMFLKAMFTLYSPTSMNSSMLIDQPNLNLPQKLLLDMLQLENRKILLPGPNPCPGIISIYHTPLQLKNYIWTKEMEVKILGEMGNGNFVNAYEESTKATNILDLTTKTQYEMCRSILPHLRRFTHLWVLVRCMAHGAVSLERERRYREAVIVYQRLLHDEMLSQFCANERGAWWDRLALCLHSHLKENDDAIEQCRMGLQDPLIGDKDRLLLQDRLMKMTRGDFITVIQVPDPVKKHITNPVLMKDIGNGRVNQFVIKSQDKVTVVSVEEVALKHYLEEEGFTGGIHIEGGIWHLALDLLFYDIIYHHKVENVWFSELQNVPSDFNYAGFYESRKVAFDERLSWLAEASTVNIEERAIRVLRANDKKHGDDLAMTPIGESDLRDFLKSCTGKLLAEVCGRVIQDRRNTRSGFPDLTLWNVETRELAVVEVKGPNDKLSTKQRLWLDVFSRQGIRAEVCHVAAVRTK